jgi:hypothetical protein
LHVKSRLKKPIVRMVLPDAGRPALLNPSEP